MHRTNDAISKMWRKFPSANVYAATPTHIAQFSNRKIPPTKEFGIIQTHPLSLSISPSMPKEVSDIKQFIEICRRKDASCTFFLLSLPSLLFPLPEKEPSFPHSRKATQLADEMVSLTLVVNSCAHKAKSQNSANQVQSPLPSISVHPRA